MLVLSGSLINRPVLSLRTNRVIANTTAFIINPNNLKIEGFYCQEINSKNKVILLWQDIRSILEQGIVVNDHDSLSQPDILVRLDKILKISYELIGKNVITVNKNKLGKVRDYALDNETFYIQKIYVGQPLVRSLKGGQLSVDRNQIVEVKDKAIVVQEPLKPQKAGITATATSSPSSA